MGFEQGLNRIGGTVPGPNINIRPDAVITNAYVASTAIDLEGYNGVTLYTVVSGNEAGVTVSVKPQWASVVTPATSLTTGDYSDEDYDGAPSISGSEQIVVPYSRVINFTIDSGAATYRRLLIRRFDRLARYFRIATKASGNTTTGKITVYASPIFNR